MSVVGMHRSAGRLEAAFAPLAISRDRKRKAASNAAAHQSRTGPPPR